jgi:hypothetical protein
VRDIALAKVSIGREGMIWEGHALSRSSPANRSSPPASATALLSSARISPANPAKLIARTWRGRTLATRADDYGKYLHDEGVGKIAGIPGDRGVQMLRMVHDGVADFEVRSYWESFNAIKRLRGATIKGRILCPTILST